MTPHPPWVWDWALKNNLFTPSRPDPDSRALLRRWLKAKGCRFAIDIDIYIAIDMSDCQGYCGVKSSVRSEPMNRSQLKDIVCNVQINPFFESNIPNP